MSRVNTPENRQHVPQIGSKPEIRRKPVPQSGKPGTQQPPQPLAQDAMTANPRSMTRSASTPSPLSTGIKPQTPSLHTVSSPSPALGAAQAEPASEGKTITPDEALKYVRDNIGKIGHKTLMARYCAPAFTAVGGLVGVTLIASALPHHVLAGILVGVLMPIIGTAIARTAQKRLNANQDVAEFQRHLAVLGDTSDPKAFADNFDTAHRASIEAQISRANRVQSFLTAQSSAKLFKSSNVETSKVLISKLGQVFRRKNNSEKEFSKKEDESTASVLRPALDFTSGDKLFDMQVPQSPQAPGLAGFSTEKADAFQSPSPATQVPSQSVPYPEGDDTQELAALQQAIAQMPLRAPAQAPKAKEAPASPMPLRQVLGDNKPKNLMSASQFQAMVAPSPQNGRSAAQPLAAAYHATEVGDLVNIKAMEKLASEEEQKALRPEKDAE
jgi:hypothetical protein